MELQRLQRNKERREARERQGKKNSFGGDVMSPEATTPGSPMISTPAPGKTVTTRKCANCGQAGHIRKFLRGVSEWVLARLTVFQVRTKNCVQS